MLSIWNKSVKSGNIKDTSFWERETQDPFFSMKKAPTNSLFLGAVLAHSMILRKRICLFGRHIKSIKFVHVVYGRPHGLRVKNELLICALE